MQKKKTLLRCEDLRVSWDLKRCKQIKIICDIRNNFYIEKKYLLDFYGEIPKVKIKTELVDSYVKL